MTNRIHLGPDNLTQGQWHSPGQHPLAVLDVAQVRAVEHAAFEQVDSFLMMQAAAVRTAERLLSLPTLWPSPNTQAVVLCGPGNNGGDGLVLAHHLHQQGHAVWVLNLGQAQAGSSDRQQAEQRVLSSTVRHSRPQDRSTPSTHAELQAIQAAIDPQQPLLIVDALLGIGCDRPATDGMQAAIEWINQYRHQHPAHAKVLALDCPSGLNCSTGVAQGPTVWADHTCTYIALKTGLLFNAGRDHAGELEVEHLGCEALLPVESARTQSHTQLARTLPRRQHQHHKGSFGALGVLGGAAGMVGAVVLSCRSALKTGCGRVAMTLAAELGERSPDVQTPGFVPFLDLLYPELMNKSLEDNLQFATAWAVGPGLGDAPHAADALAQVLELNKPTVLDADALNLLAQQPQLAPRLADAHTQRNWVLTPHPLEAARLLGTTADAVNTHRVDSALKIAQEFNSVVVLKGAGTVVANPTGQVHINVTGGPLLATAGSGDVLTGVIASLLAQGLNPWQAACTGTWLHGAACLPLPNETVAPQVCGASELIQRIAAVLNCCLSAGA